MDPYSQIVPNALLKLDRWIIQENWPSVLCPECSEGTIHLEGELITLRDPASEELLEDIDAHLAGPAELTGTCAGTFRCNNPECRRTVLISGDWSYDIDVDVTGGTRWANYLRVRYFSPPLPIFTPPAKTPEKVAAAILSASELLWINPNAAANQLRQGIEELLTTKRVKRYQLVKKKGTTQKRRKWLSAHERIGLYRDANPAHKDIADTLEAVKWIGNSGSHDTGLTIADVLEGAGLLEHALTELYDPASRQRAARVKQINTRKGIPRTKMTAK